MDLVSAITAALEAPYGLSNVRAAVEKHGGILHVHANQEKQEFQLSIMLPTAPYAKTTASDSP